MKIILNKTGSFFTYMQPFRFSAYFFALFSFVILTSCDTSDPFRVEPPDFSTVPDPYDTSNVDAVTIEEGVKAYFHEDGYGEFQVTLRDQVGVYLTLRTQTGEILYSTFSNDRKSPVVVNMSIADGLNPNIHQSIFDKNTILLTYTPGFKKALLNRKPGERFTLVVSPEEGFQTIPRNAVNNLYRDETLIYNIRISSVGPAKSQ